ncbi:DUF3231 family protein [Halobacillus kuroshimensis]|uniref:DUF3231 family protein n=1 Tax=Halobacillus kuroshimensis TaxID=302481 RepID=A0ABS3DYU1_9BACI|nr:DUF3231 family protein [Halobacillus kuroshimensis]MBN8236489.1 DUF3231 family protein [Halobacillus kuroshimensis]
MPEKKLTANEIGLLWTQYIQNSMAVPVLEYLKNTCEDEEVKPLIQLSRDLADKGIDTCRAFFQEACLPVPNGFSLEDLNPRAKKLFTDAFILSFLEHMGKVGLTSDGYSLGASANSDVRAFFTDRIDQQDKLYNLSVRAALEKGIYTRAPQIEVLNETEYIESKAYYHPFHKRSLNTIEITHIYENVKNNALGEVVCQAFGQTSKNKTVKKYMRRGKRISIDHRICLSDILENSGITVPMTSASLLTTSTDPVFSDRLMMYMISVLISAGQGNYVNGAAVSLRYDIVYHYHKLMLQAAVYGKDGLDIMIENGWFEEPPQAPDRQRLIQ